VVPTPEVARTDEETGPETVDDENAPAPSDEEKRR
jgi:hypothetical protein